MGIVPKQVCHFSSLSILCLGCKTIRRRAARRLIVLHPTQIIESDIKWQTCSGRMPSKVSCLSWKGLKNICQSCLEEASDEPRHQQSVTILTQQEKIILFSRITLIRE